MKEKIKRRIILLLIPSIVVVGTINVTYGIYFGVLTNVLINAFWNSKLFPKKEKTNRELIVECVSPPKF
jgi:MFS superfamily sulfate permease-like transporter